MQSIVFGHAQNDQILRPVIGRISVDVVNGFCRSNRPTVLFLSYDDVAKNIPLAVCAGVFRPKHRHAATRLNSLTAVPVGVIRAGRNTAESIAVSGAIGPPSMNLLVPGYGCATAAGAERSRSTVDGPVGATETAATCRVTVSDVPRINNGLGAAVTSATPTTTAIAGVGAKHNQLAKASADVGFNPDSLRHISYCSTTGWVVGPDPDDVIALALWERQRHE